MNNISLEIIEKIAEKEKKVTIREERNTIKIIPSEGKGNRLPKREVNSNSLTPAPKRQVAQPISVVQRQVAQPISVVQRQVAQPISAPFMMNFNRNIGMMPMRFR